MRRTPPLIIGAGPAGCSAALTLLARDIPARIVERDFIVRDAVCGGFMSWQTLAALDRLGVVVGGHLIRRVVVFAGSRCAEATLPGRAVGLSRRTLDTVLQCAVTERGGVIERGIEAKSFDQGHLRLSTGETIADEPLFLAVGKHDLRGAARPREDTDLAVGLRIRLPASPRLATLIGDAIELHMFDRGYVGINLQEDGSANICLAVRKSRLNEAGGRCEALLENWGRLSPLGERLGLSGATPADAVAAIPYGWRALDTQPGVFRLGDQAAVIPSLAGEGIGIAIASGIAAATTFANKGPRSAQVYQRAFAARTQRPLWIARALWRQAERPSAARLAVPLLGIFPGLLRLAAHTTRIGAERD